MDFWEMTSDSGYMFLPVYGGFCTRILRSILVCLPRRVQDLDLVLCSCRQRHWYAWAGFAGVDALRAVFISFVTVYSALLGPQWYMLCVSLRSGRISCFST